MEQNPAQAQEPQTTTTYQAAPAAEAAAPPVVATTSSESAAVAVHHTGTLATPQESKQAIAAVGEGTVYIMGISFILGCLFTVFLLLVLDCIRDNFTNRSRKASVR